LGVRLGQVFLEYISRKLFAMQLGWARAVLLENETFLPESLVSLGRDSRFEQTAPSGCCCSSCWGPGTPPPPQLRSCCSSFAGNGQEQH
jgi:hypothetical protein